MQDRNLKIQGIILVIYFFLIPMESWDPLNIGGGLTFAKIFGYLYALSIIPHLSHFLNIPQKTSKVIYLAISFYLLLVIMNIIHINVYTEEFLHFSIIQNIILFLLVLNHERLQPGIIEKGFVFFFLGIILLTVLFNLGYGVDYTQNRLTIFNENQNKIGVKLAIGLIVNLYLILYYRERLSKLVYLLLFAPIAPIILFMMGTGSRTALAIFLLSFVVISVLYKTKYVASKLFVIATGAVLAGVIITVALNTAVLGTRLMRVQDSGDLSGRDVIWSKILPVIEDNPVFGVGRTGFSEYAIQTFGGPISPHNVFLELLAYTGTVGFIIFLSLIFYAFHSAYKYYVKTNYVAPLVFLIPILGMMFSQQMLNHKIAWLILAFAASRAYYLDTYVQDPLRNR